MERRKSHHSSLGVGKMILDILPGKVDVNNEKVARPQAPPCIVQPRPVVATLPTVQLPATPPHAAGASFPRVVVVNPTPHPTPPATPNIPHPPTLTAAAAQPSTHLLPPQPARSLISATIAPTPTSSQSAVPSAAAPRPQPALAAPAPVSSASKRSPHDAPQSTGATGTKSKTYNDETLKASDRRFFLSGSPDVDSPERPPSNHSNASNTSNASNPSEGKAHSPSSATSSHMKSEVAAHTAVKRPRVAVRKGSVRPALQRLHSHGLRQTSSKRSAGAEPKKSAATAVVPPAATTAEPKKAMFNIGSASSSGSRAGPSTKAPSTNGDAAPPANQTRPPSPAPAPPAAPPAPAKKAAPAQPAGTAGPSQQRRGIVISTSSEYETTDTDDDSDWASEGDSGEEREKEKKAKAAEEARLREAAEEAQRQRDMFAKVPKRSYSNLNRTRSGLLSQLLNPDPNIFPPNHPYRSSRSTQDMTQLGRQGSAPTLQMSKSSAAVPLAAQVTAQVAPTVPAADNGRSNGGYRPKGRPQELELEDTESEDDNPDDTIQVSRSIAQQKLAALADPARRRHSDRGLLSQQKQHEQQMQEAGARPGLTTVATAPIPLNHPYNLPAPAPPMTPRTTRRQMLQTELSESLRRNLLWERQVSRVNMTGRRGGVLGSGIRPLTAMNGDGPTGAQQQQPAAQNGAQGQQQQGQPPLNADDREERRRRAMARNRSWADDYHYSGW
ncbi:hypothetical protein BD413DRAFT_476299 [Trametes elegans]|nr:hypothetical protein BD413DRAFT_476299 [Trametes elegans]